MGATCVHDAYLFKKDYMKPDALKSYNLESNPAQDRSPGQCELGQTCRMASQMCLYERVSCDIQKGVRDIATYCT